ncbi:SLBB domain-containing protein [Massilia sp. ZL223]|uniref:SLBB domain-containing protein n=1 Tax=Massilia sp. ZL223 TaxID=2824904 RepID=UPI001E347977|nr:SLBB domain-containing protein [Massilia sp. ZL223]
MSKINRTVLAVALAVTSIASHAQQAPQNQVDDRFGQEQQAMPSEIFAQPRRVSITNAGVVGLGEGAPAPDGLVEREGPLDAAERGSWQQGEGAALRQQRDGGLARAPQGRTKREPLSEFQKFVLENTGTVLPVYGTEFFANAPSTFAPISNTPVPSEYPLGPGDQLLIRGWGTIDIDFRATIDRNGTINIPTIGTVVLGGVKAGDAEGLIRSAVARLYKGVTVSVNFGQLRAITVYVVGQAKRPGTYTVSSLSTLVNALFASGGPNATGSMRRVQVKRAGKVVAELDLYAFIAKGDKSGDIKLQDGDSIYIPAASGYVALTGKVNVPAIYELKSGESISSVLDIAGGLPVLADPRRAFLERIDPSKARPRSVEQFALDAEGLKRGLKTGDLLNVTSITPDFSNAVILRGNVDQPVRAPFKDGMRVSDLIPSKEYLITRESVRRQNNAVSVNDSPQARVQGQSQGQWQGQGMGQWQGLGQAGLGQGLGQVQGAGQGEQAESITARIGSLIDEINWDYAVVERVNRQDLSVKLIPFNLGNVFSQPDGPDNIQLQPGDTVTVFSQNDVAVPMDKRRVFVRIEGEVNVPGVYQMTAGETLQSLLAKAGGPTSNAYLFGTAFYREEVRKEQEANLEKAANRLESKLRSEQSRGLANVRAAGSAEAQAAVSQRQAEVQIAKETIERFRQLKPTGRIAFGLKPAERSFASLPQIKLENGDRLVIPARPAFVHVFGAVNAEASPLWRPNSRVKDYLELAGVTSEADVANTFIMRIDGTVVSRDSGGFFGGIGGLEVMPGDSIVIPEKFDKETAWTKFTQGTREWAQIFANFGLGAAAIKTLNN